MLSSLPPNPNPGSKPLLHLLSNLSTANTTADTLQQARTRSARAPSYLGRFVPKRSTLPRARLTPENQSAHLKQPTAKQATTDITTASSSLQAHRFALALALPCSEGGRGRRGVSGRHALLVSGLRIREGTGGFEAGRGGREGEGEGARGEARVVGRSAAAGGGGALVRWSGRKGGAGHAASGGSEFGSAKGKVEQRLAVSGELQGQQRTGAGAPCVEWLR